MYKEKSYILDTIKQLQEDVENLSLEVHENNIMLKQILLNHNNDNNEDFIRNILANLVSNGLDFNRFRR